MKKFITVVALMLSTHSFAATSACNGNLEAQFDGQVTSVKFLDIIASTTDRAVYTIGRFTKFQANPSCPLDDQMAASAQLIVEGITSPLVGQAISGVLVYNPTLNLFSIE